MNKIRYYRRELADPFMKKILSALALTAFLHPVQAQYYYKDLVANQQANQQYSLLIKEGIKKVSLSSFDGNSTETAGFSCEQEINSGKRTVSTSTHTAVMGDTYLVATYNAAGQLVNTTDSAQNAASTTTYSYDASGRLVTIATSSRSDNVTTSEIHLYTYDANGHPATLLRIRDQHDTTAVQFVLDENGNIAEERATRKNQAQPTIFYYYDAQHRLTDVVRFNVKAQRLLPDYIFEYTENGLLKKMLVVPSGTNEYQTWYYQYEPGGLKKLDLCYNKAQQLVGKVVYEYSR